MIGSKFQVDVRNIMFSGLPREKRNIWANSRKDGLDHLGYIIAYPTT
jgi:hypothetical protein